MKTVETRVFQYDELPTEQAKEKARDWFRRASEGDSFFAECVIDDAKRMASLIGIDVDKVYYSGFASQGDGACFTGWYSYKRGGLKAIKSEAPQDKELHRIAAELQSIQRVNFYRLSASVTHSGHYSHEGCTAIDVQFADRYAAVSEFADEGIQEALRDFMRWIYKQLETEYEYRNADEQVEEDIRANEYDFTEDGERF